MLVQSFIVQTHIHARPALALSGALMATSDVTVATLTPAADKSQTPKKVPIDDDQANCSLCQQTHTSGQFFAPSSAAYSLAPFHNLQRIAYAAPSVVEPGVSHSWRGRAPPQA